MRNTAALADRIDDLLPQTQCGRCAHPGCRPYAEAIAAGTVPINRCAPGGTATIAALAALLDVPAPSPDPAFGVAEPLTLARIDEAVCIGCTLCIQACPVDAIVGAAKRMHTVLADHCTGCGLCLPPCPVDCIVMTAAATRVDRGRRRGRAHPVSIAQFAARATRRQAHVAPGCQGNVARAECDARRAPEDGRGGPRPSPRPPGSGQPVNPAKRRAIYERLRQQNPHPRSELSYRTPFELLIAVVLSAQATDKSVNLATAKLFPVARTPQAIVKLGEAGLIPYIQTIGLFRTKAKNVVALCRQLIAEHGGEVPADHDALVRLPGVGRKTANVVMNVAFGQPTIAVDTHIFRVANRTGLAPGSTPEEVERKLVKFTPEEFRHDAHHWLILHGRYICQARKPLCPQCVIVDLCEYRHKTV